MKYSKKLMIKERLWFIILCKNWQSSHKSFGIYSKDEKVYIIDLFYFFFQIKRNYQRIFLNILSYKILMPFWYFTTYEYASCLSFCRFHNVFHMNIHTYICVCIYTWLYTWHISCMWSTFRKCTYRPFSIIHIYIRHRCRRRRRHYLRLLLTSTLSKRFMLVSHFFFSLPHVTQ